ncbi:3-deoxy-D-manno-octulosonic acid transferase [Rubrivivax rivuli]|uniref:3-deoxy-D-manno-octulosonic acid transferase n=1 Tax=Rubrivivax rivuli TaxID=1862385 RepID=A0A437RCU8_9BURK|nr:3-deoxy-D-manno-octulosonic acid transferase [Rubrivivax rivuli]RVU44575.1 3-deoxy-D-manno-octulosonic acid transferase [Rubrivivax rivuli]
MSEPLARALYALLLRLATPLYLARLWWRGRREPAYRSHWRERLGWPAAGTPPVPGRLWLHAVSLGETLAAAPLVQALREQRPGLQFLLTHSTATGREAGAKLLQPGDAQAWLPYDTPGAVRRFLRAHRPSGGVLMETEIWPVLLHAAQAEGVPVVLANARLSARSARKGRRLATLLHGAAARLSTALAQTDADAQRLAEAGARKVQVMGNLKFDITPRPELLARGQAWRQLLGRPVVLAAVTREGEEALLLAAWAALPAAGRPLLLIVPRHPQRFDEVAALVAEAGFSLQRRSAWGTSPAPEAVRAEVWLGDSLGEMAQYYACADVALLGGSFAPLGGQNLIEAAACGCPLLMGPHTFNFAQAAEDALAAGAAERLPDLPSAVARGCALLAAAGAADREVMVVRARRFAAAHRGAAARMAAAVLAVQKPAPR